MFWFYDMRLRRTGDFWSLGLPLAFFICFSWFLTTPCPLWCCVLVFAFFFLVIEFAKSFWCLDYCLVE
jgi:hypothetical protein